MYKKIFLLFIMLYSCSATAQNNAKTYSFDRRKDGYALLGVIYSLAGTKMALKNTLTKFPAWVSLLALGYANITYCEQIAEIAENLEFPLHKIKAFKQKFHNAKEALKKALEQPKED